MRTGGPTSVVGYPGTARRSGLSGTLVGRPALHAVVRGPAGDIGGSISSLRGALGEGAIVCG